MKFNPALAAFKQRLAEKGKRAKVILTAVARKLLVMANALVRSGTTWQADFAAAN